MVMGPEGMEKGGELSMRVSREMRGSDALEERGRERREGGSGARLLMLRESVQG